MASSSVSWGIEIGAGAIKALKLENAGEKVNVLDFAIIPHAKVLSTPGIDANDVLRVSLGTLASQYDLSKASIAVSVPGHAAFARFAKLPPVEPKKVPDIVKFEAVQQIPFPLEQVEWDYQTFVSPDSPDVEVGIFAITRERIMERLALLADVNINPDFVTLSPIAAYNALAYDLNFSEQTPGTIILDIGTTATDLVIAEAGRVWVRTFPIGGHQFTEALVNQFKLSYPKAEKLKREAEEGVNARHVFQAMRPVFTDLAQDVQRSIGYYQSLHKDAKLVRLLGLGSTFRVPGLRKYLKQQLGLDVYRIEEYKRLNLDAIKEEQRFQLLEHSAVHMATAYGLALQALGLNTMTANLMPVSVIRSAMWKQKVPWFGLVAGLGLLAGGAMFIRPIRDHFAINAETAQPAPELEQIKARLSKLKSEATQAGVVGAATPDMKAANMLAMLEGRAIYARLVEDLGEMFAAANTIAKQKKLVDPAWDLRTYEAVYAPPGGQDGPDSGFPNEGNFGGRGGKGASPAMPQPEVGATGAEGPAKVRITMTVGTTQNKGASVQQLMIDTLPKWLEQNAVRDGVPYKVVGKPKWQVLSSNIVAEPDATQPNNQSAPEAPPPGRRGGNPRSPGGKEQALPPGVSIGSTGGGGGNAPPPSNWNPGAVTDTGPGEAGQLAPLADLKPVPQPGQETAVFRVTYEVELLPKTPAPPAGGAA